jgi:hypothetical protein
MRVGGQRLMFRSFANISRRIIHRVRGTNARSRSSENGEARVENSLVDRA